MIGHVPSFLGQDEVAVLSIARFLAIWVHCVSACESDLTIVISYSPLDIVGGSELQSPPAGSLKALWIPFLFRTIIVAIAFEAVFTSLAARAMLVDIVVASSHVVVADLFDSAIFDI